MVHLSLKLPLIFWPSRFVLDFLAEENRIERFEPLESWRWTATAAPRCHSIKRIVLSTTTKPILRLGCSGLLSMPLLLGSKFWQIPDLDQNISAKLWFRYASPVNLVTDKEKWVKTEFAASTWHFIVTRRRSSPTTPTNLRTWQSLLYGKNSVWSGLYADTVVNCKFWELLALLPHNHTTSICLLEGLGYCFIIRRAKHLTRIPFPPGRARLDSESEYM